MKKALFTSLIALAAAASFADSPAPVWDHANDSGPIPSLTEVQHPYTYNERKDDDRIKFTVPATGVREMTSIGHNDTYERQLQNGAD